MSRILFTVVQDDYGIRIDWSPELIPALDDGGERADRVIDVAEELLAELAVRPRP